MKIDMKLEIECTPAEVRHSLGLPDLEPMQTAVMGHIEKKVVGHIERFSPDTLINAWFSPFQRAEQVQKLFRHFYLQGSNNVPKQ